MLEPYDATQYGYVGNYALRAEARHWRKIAEQLDARVTELEQQLLNTQEALRVANEWRDYNG